MGKLLYFDPDLGELIALFLNLRYNFFGDIMVIKRLRDLREDRDLKQKDIAKVLNIPSHTYGNYELGIRGIPLEILIELAIFYETSVDYVLGLTDVKRPYERNKKFHQY